MQGFSYIIKNPNGLHIEPASKIIKLAATFVSSINLRCQSRAVSLKSSIFGLMGLGLSYGDIVEVYFDGSDEEQASQAFQQLFQQVL